MKNYLKWLTVVDSESSTFCFAVTIVAMQYFTAVASNCEDLKKLLSLNNPHAMLAKASSAVVKSRTSFDLTMLNAV